MPKEWEYMDEHAKKKTRTPLDDKIDGRLMKKRILILNGELEEERVDRICRKLILLGTEKSKAPIRIILNSVGGEVFLGLLTYNTIMDLRSKGIPIEIETRGLAASMGCIILQSGSRRIARKYTRFLIHEITSITFGKSSEIKEQAQEIIKLNNMLRDIIANHTGKTPKQIRKLWFKKDVWMSAEEALKFGLLDEIV